MYVNVVLSQRIVTTDSQILHKHLCMYHMMYIDAFFCGDSSGTPRTLPNCPKTTKYNTVRWGWKGWKILGRDLYLPDDDESEDQVDLAELFDKENIR